MFKSILEQALAASPTPWALQIQRLTPDLAPWDLEDHAGVRELLCELGHQGALSRDAHLRLLSERCGVALITLQEAARELAQGADADPSRNFRFPGYSRRCQSILKVLNDTARLVRFPVHPTATVPTSAALWTP